MVLIGVEQEGRGRSSARATEGGEEGRREGDVWTNESFEDGRIWKGEEGEISTDGDGSEGTLEDSPIPLAAKDGL